MLAEISQFVQPAKLRLAMLAGKQNLKNILLFLLILLLCMLSFGAGILVQHYLQKSPLEIIL